MTLPTEALEAIIAGCATASKGPWTSTQHGDVLTLVGKEPVALMCGSSGQDYRNGQYIARLSPEVVRAMATELLAYRRAEK